MQLTPQTLQGRVVRLEPIEEAHREALRPAANDRDIWRFFPDRGDGPHFDALFDRRLAAQRDGSWIVHDVRRLADCALIGQTCFLNIDSVSARVEIGGTWYVAAARGGAVNPECKLLLMAAAFAAGARRVELKTDARNGRSRAAILKLGAVEEGTLRRHTLMWDGFVRDTVYYSVLEDEWPLVCEGLRGRLGRTPGALPLDPAGD
jgi:RimJ/RimL family protein N-acetyltransferase